MDQEELARRSADIAQSAADAAWLAAYAALATAILSLGLLVGAVLAWRVAKATLDQSKAAHRQMEKDSVEQTRPYVYAHLVPGLAGTSTWDLLITNTGKSTARELLIDCDPWPEIDDELTGPLRKMFSTPQSLPPGVSLRTMWKLGLGENERWADGTTDPAGIASGATLRLTYTSDDASKPSYRDVYRLDDSVIGMTPVPSTGPAAKPGLTAAEKDLHNVLRAATLHLGELRR
jgi:hypothetical protein